MTADGANWACVQKSELDESYVECSHADEMLSLSSRKITSRPTLVALLLAAAAAAPPPRRRRAAAAPPPRRRRAAAHGRHRPGTAGGRPPPRRGSRAGRGRVQDA
ncbi:hypothetical protein ACU635_38690 [[Actinomadura] parvosata]|uniref:hypothetical protein n=1 Tax=[Actinomadura] parvosata TaxID=1955412 RepID=UPI00406CEC39